LFLDTPFIFNLLGIHGILKKSLAEELIYILHEEKVNLFVLEITQSEINGNLEEALKLLERGKSDPTKGSLTFRACIENGFNENDVEQILLSLPSFYAKYKIMYNDLPNYDDFRDFQIDEVKLYNTIVETYDEIIGTKKEKEKNEPECDEKTKDERINNTIFRDVQVLSGIYRYRLGIAPKTLKDCKYLFITTNSSLAHASRRFEKTEQKKRYSLPTCLTDVFLGTLIWLHSPTRLESINEKKIIADSFAALKPDEKLIACYLEDVERLRKSGVIDHDSYILLRTHRAAINILENKTLGDINEFTAQTTEEVLNELIEHIKYQEHEKFIQEKREHEKTQNHLKELREKHSNILEEIKIRDQADLQSAIELNARIQKRAHRNAKTTVLCLQILLASILIGSGLIIFLNQYCNLTIARWFLIVNVALTIISGLLNIITGFNVASIREILLTKLVVVYVDKYKNRVNKYNLSGKVKC